MSAPGSVQSLHQSYSLHVTVAIPRKGKGRQSTAQQQTIAPASTQLQLAPITSHCIQPAAHFKLQLRATHRHTFNPLLHVQVHFTMAIHLQLHPYPSTTGYSSGCAIVVACDPDGHKRYQTTLQALDRSARLPQLVTLLRSEPRGCRKLTNTLQHESARCQTVAS